MAARRLIIVLLILLGVSIFATALAPVESGDDDPPPAAPESVAPAPSTPEAELPQTLFIHAGARKPETLPLDVGEPVTLEVSSKTSGIVEIPALGLTQPVSASAPARFDLLPRDAGTYDVRMFEGNQLIGRLKVSPEPAPGEPPRA